MLVEKIGLPGKAKPTDPSLMCKQAYDYWNDAYPRNAVLEFSRDRKSMSTLCGLSAGGGGGGKSPARGRSPAKSPARSKSPAKGKSPARAKSGEEDNRRRDGRQHAVREGYALGRASDVAPRMHTAP